MAKGLTRVPGLATQPAKQPSSPLEDFLVSSHRTTEREHLLTSRLMHDLGITAASQGAPFQFYLPAVDNKGFDLIIDDGERLVPIQLKSRILYGRETKWSIHKSLVLPEVEDITFTDFDASSGPRGRGGGVLLTLIASKANEVELTYEYTDLYVLTALWNGILGHPRSKARLARLEKEMHDPKKATISIPRTAFLRAPSFPKLLILMGLNRSPQTDWRFEMRSLLDPGLQDEVNRSLREEVVQRIRSILHSATT